MKFPMVEIFYTLLLFDMLALVVFTPVLIFFSRRFSKSLGSLIRELPESAIDKLKEQSRDGTISVGRYIRESIRNQFKQPDYLVNLIISEDYDSFGIKTYREECYKNYRVYKRLFCFTIVLFVFLIISALGIYFHYA